jgi:hypothetical protein
MAGYGEHVRERSNELLITLSGQRLFHEVGNCGPSSAIDEDDVAEAKPGFVLGVEAIEPGL